MFSFERAHPFHGKTDPAIVAGPRCIRDLSVFFRSSALPDNRQAVLDDGQTVDMQGTIEDSAAETVQMVLDHEFHSVDYSTKATPRADNPPHSLRDSKGRQDRSAAERPGDGPGDDGAERARRLLRSLVGATRRILQMRFLLS
eukprot:9486821-Pyramimonas_sp.AAC.1